MPTPSAKTEVAGIFQSDIIIRTAVIECLRDARDNPWLLDYIFQGLIKDTLTSDQYGQNDLDQAKIWFANTDIPVVFDIRMEKANWPCVAITLLDSVESEFTLGDIFYTPFESTFDDWPIIAGPFTPTAYSQSTGIMKIPATALTGIVLDSGMILIDKVGTGHPVLEVLDDDTISLTPNTLGDFSKCMLRDGNPGLITPMEAINNRETYQLTLAVPGEPVHLLYLHSILTFMLNRRKQDLLEARGFERSTMSSGKVERYSPTETEVVFARTVNLVGFVKNVWVKDNKQVVQGIGQTLTVGGPDSVPPGFDANGQVDDGTQSWTVEETP